MQGPGSLGKSHMSAGRPGVEGSECPSPSKIMQLLLSLWQSPQVKLSRLLTPHTWGPSPIDVSGTLAGRRQNGAVRSVLSLLVTGLLASPETLAHQALPTCYLIVLCRTHTPDTRYRVRAVPRACKALPPAFDRNLLPTLLTSTSGWRSRGGFPRPPWPRWSNPCMRLRHAINIC